MVQRHYLSIIVFTVNLSSQIVCSFQCLFCGRAGAFRDGRAILRVVAGDKEPARAGTLCRSTLCVNT